MTQPLSVLVVEDDPDTLSAVGTVLRETDGVRVWVARTAEQALEVAGELDYAADVLVVDLDLGPGVTGDDFVAAYRQRAKSPFRVVLLSGSSHIYQSAAALKAHAVLPKPWDADDLVSAVRYIDESQPRH